MVFLIRSEHINIASVLSAFSLSLFAIIQFYMAPTHACRRIIAKYGLLGCDLLNSMLDILLSCPSHNCIPLAGTC